MSQPWHAIYPTPRITAAYVSRTKLLQWLKEGKKQTNKDLIIIDLRRTDCEGGMISGSLNLPAQSLYPSIPTLYSVLTQGRISKVVWYCGSSRGRGPRAAGWFADYLAEQRDNRMESLVLEEGIKGWVAAGEEFTQWMTGYEELKWTI
ncbi:putative arsenate reductase (Arc2) [Aspergillus homomorphus CBS 101889]|uniref:Rhodanese domain-containing protein n=1 Tax=Aspergillus homomorphus (strain CBS 101889) TaxID=1450537 RepID=A0A395IBN8_ASPHC|nr:hypothetical protein BO97DRAFT_333548 [Aspergillus homomorphus CBS 101889]RAL17405.1 hypothetical protein BO97DRAFT_333548 [Aspergillus homomorphus CBS 101889]